MCHLQNYSENLIIFGTGIFPSTPRPDRLWGPPTYQMDAGSPFLGVKRPGVKLTTHIHLVLRLKHVELYLHPSYVFMAWCLVKHRDNFTFTLPVNGLNNMNVNFMNVSFTNIDRSLWEDLL